MSPAKEVANVEVARGKLSRPVSMSIEMNTANPGWALGGVASLRIEVASAWAVEALYRESHAFLEAALGDVQDVERYGTLNIIYEP